jgi:hypothetical protein
MLFEMLPSFIHHFKVLKALVLILVQADETSI